MKKICTILTMLIILFGAGRYTHAQEGITQEQFLTSYLRYILPTSNIPQSAKYIQVRYPKVPNQTLYRLMQQAIVLDILPNAQASLDWQSRISQKQVAGRISLVQKKDIAYQDNVLADGQWVQKTLQSLASLPSVAEISPQPMEQEIFNNVFQVLQQDHVDAQSFSGTQLRYGAIKGLVGATKDIHTNFFTPQEAKQFTDELAGEFQGIGAYVEMLTPGRVHIINPIAGSPAQAVGLKAKDQIIQVDDHIVQKDTSLDTVIGWIKGPADTSVHIYILRGDTQLDFVITRKKILIPDMETKMYTGGTCYIALHSFDVVLAKNFSKALEGDFSADHCIKYIIDLRDNPGGSLQEVLSMLDYIVPTGSVSAQVGSQQSTTKYYASPISGTKITNKPLFLLINGGSASAAEIFVASTKEYAPYAKIIGEKSYGKGTVQTMLSYPDGSLLKYTIARRYTGKDKKNIDKIGILPQVELEDLASTPQDEVLEYALK